VTYAPPADLNFSYERRSPRDYQTAGEFYRYSKGYICSLEKYTKRQSLLA